MRVYITYLIFSFFATEVLASLAAGPFQSVFFYYAYRIDTIVSPDSYLIGAECLGSGPRGVCYFDEFVKWIQASNRPWTGQTSVGDNLDPDAYTVAEDLTTAGTEGTTSRCANIYDPHKLFPSLYPEGSKPTFVTLMKALTSRIQDHRLIFGDDQITSQLNNARRALGLTYEARIGDMTSHLILDLNNMLVDKGVTWTCETYEKDLGHGYTIEMVDTLGTIDAHPDMGDTLESAIWDLVDNYDHAKSIPRSHYKIIQALQAYQNLLNGACT